MTKQERAEYDRAYRKANRASINAKIKAWRNLHLDDQKEKEAARRKLKAIEYASVRILWEMKNADHIKAYEAARRKANPQRSSKASKAWKDAHPEARRNHVRNRRAKLRDGGVLSSGIERKLMELQKGKCPVCRSSLSGAFHLDHIVAVANGGRNEDDNVQLLCPPCNQSKSDRNPVDFMQSRGFLL